MTPVKGILFRPRHPDTIARLDAAVEAAGVKTRNRYLNQVIEAHLDEIDISSAVREDEEADLELPTTSTHMMAGARRSPAASGGAADGPRKDHAGHSGRASCPVTPASDPATGSGKAGSPTEDEEIKF